MSYTTIYDYFLLPASVPTTVCCGGLWAAALGSGFGCGFGLWLWVARALLLLTPFPSAPTRCLLAHGEPAELSY